MLLRRLERQHQQMKRLHNVNPAPTPVLEARDPGLTINIALPLLPTLGITIGGSKPTSTAPAVTTPAPIPTTTTSSNNGDTNNGGGNNGGTNNGGTNNGNGNSGSDNGGSNNGNGDNGGSNGGNGGSSTGGGSSTTNSPAPSPSSPASGGEAPSTDSGTENTPSTGGQDPGTSSSDDGGSNPPHNLAGSSGFPSQGDSDGDGSGGSSSSGSSGSSGSNGGVTGIVNAGVIPGASSTGGASSRGTTTYGTGGTIAAPTSTNTTDGSGDNEHGGTVGASSKTAGIAVGIILALLFLLGLLLLLRRYRRARRNEERQKWWFTKKRTSQTYNDDKLIVQIPPTPASARSSFATNIDHSNSFEVNFNTPLPTMPPTAELRRSRNDLQYPAPATTDSGHAVDPRFSLGSVNSSDSQYLFVNHRPSFETNDLNHAGSSSPFTPLAERYAFPKPPSDASSEVSNRISGTEETGKTYLTPNTSPTPPEHPDLPPLANPFADTPGPMSTLTHTTDPFSDSTVSTSHAHGTTESASANPPVPVTRPFTSRLADEVTLAVGDQVNVHQIFDDGWALVDKMAEGAAVQRGLVPIACLR